MNSKHWGMIVVLIFGIGAVWALGPWMPAVLAAGHGGGAENLDPMNIKSDLALWTLVTFLIVLLILWKFAFGPIVRGLDAREKYVHDQRSDAETANTDAQRLLAEYKEQLAGARSEIQILRDEAQTAAEKIREDAKNTAKKEVDAVKETAAREIASAKIQAKKELAAASANLAVEIAGKILQKQLNPEAHRALIDQAVAKFSS